MHPESTARGITTGIFATSLVTNLKAKIYCQIIRFHEKFVLKIADLLSFAIAVCLDFHFCAGGGKIF